MAEYIEKKTVIRELFDVYERDFPTADGAFDLFVTRIMPQAIRNISAADVAPVRHGHWIDCEDEYSSYVRCSVCGDEFTCWEADCAHTDFCPGCGADMRGDDNGK